MGGGKKKIRPAPPLKIANILYPTAEKWKENTNSMLHTRREGEGRGRRRLSMEGQRGGAWMFHVLILWFGWGGEWVIMSAAQFDPQL